MVRDAPLSLLCAVAHCWLIVAVRLCVVLRIWIASTGHFAVGTLIGGIALSEETPRLHLSATDIRQWAEVFVLISQWSARRRQRLEMEGRLAEADGEHASRLDDARAEPAVRPMTTDEQQEWFDRIPAGLRSQREESFTVWTAQVGQGWGVEANTWDTATGTPTSTLLVVCRDDDDAIDLCRHLREHHTSDDLVRLQQTAVDAVRRPAPTDAPRSPEATPGSGRHRTPLVLSEDAWKAALRAELPPRLADRIIVKDPAHPHHTAWRELCALANEEVGRVGADPAALARLVRTVPTWSENVRKPPALAHWALTEMRSSPNYEQAVRPRPAAGPDPTASPSTTADESFVVDGQVVSNRLRLDQVTSPQQALHWAKGLEANNPQHRLEAKNGVGRWGSGVDAELARKFPGLMQATNAAAQRQRDREERREEQVAVHVPEETAPAETTDDPERTARLLEEIDRLDPAKSGDRLHAFAMFGHVSSPDVDLALARKFGADDRFTQKLVAQYPGGLTEIGEAAAWRGRANANEQRSAAHMAVPDDPDTPPREDVLARSTATGDQQTAAAQRAAAAAVTNTPPVMRPAEPSRGRSR